MKKFKLILTLTIIFWVIIVGIDAYIQIRKGISLPGYGYETQWQFQLLVFLTTRFVLHLFFLICAIIAEYLILRKWVNSGNH